MNGEGTKTESGIARFLKMDVDRFMDWLDESTASEEQAWAMSRFVIPLGLAITFGIMLYAGNELLPALLIGGGLGGLSALFAHRRLGRGLGLGTLGRLGRGLGLGTLGSIDRNNADILCGTFFAFLSLGLIQLSGFWQALGMALAIAGVFTVTNSSSVILLLRRAKDRKMMVTLETPPIV